MGQIKYTITEGGFVYHTKKGKLKQGNIISKETHPLSEVNEFRERLIKERFLKDIGDYYQCSKGISTGVLMAYNLHKGKLMCTLPEFDVIINGNDSEIKDAFMCKSFFSADNHFRNRLEKDSFRIVKIIQANYDKGFFQRKGDGSLSKQEQFVVDALRKAGEIDQFRRGNALKNECDIIDEQNGRQIEIVTFLDEKIPPNVRRSSTLAREQALALESCDFGFSVVSEGVIKKFTEKNYTNEYAKELAIYFIGNNNEAGRKLRAIEGEVRTRIDKVKNDFRQIHLIIHDPLVSESITYCSSNRCVSFPDSCCSVNPVRRKEVCCGEVENDSTYFLLRENIFKPEEKQAAWLSGKELRLYKLI